MKIVMKFILSLFLGGLIMSLASANEVQIMSTSLEESVNTNKSEELFAEDGSTPYDTITRWYESAKSVPFSHVANTRYEGRCFFVHDKTKSNMVDVAFRSYRANNSGPAFSPVENKVALVKILTTNASKREFFDFLDQNWSVFKTKLNQNSPLNYNQGNMEGEVKLFEEYYVTMSLYNQDEKCSKDTSDYYQKICKKNKGVIPKGTESAACYFYKKID